MTNDTAPRVVRAYTASSRNQRTIRPLPVSGRGLSQQMSQTQSSPGSWSRTLDALVNGVIGEIPSHEIFTQTSRGTRIAVHGHAEIPDRLRMLLFLVNGRRSMAEYRDLLPRYRNLDDAFDMLVKMGFIERATDPAEH